ncbi:MAG: SUMF1/EgtB/PvdO family nonheme iron enzyme [Planctomycetes bacterium]|nr:SUMF1/EgtB/PvdO family nonheme iron enzyme [Planctomycetota bacterium]
METRRHPAPAEIGAEALRSRLFAELRAARARTDAVFAMLRPEGFYARAIAERHRLIFYLGHLEVFDWNLLVRDCLGRPSRHREWEQLFAFGIDPVDGELPTDAPEDWPTIADVRAFGDERRADVDRALAQAPLRDWLADGWAWHMAIEHRAMHAETLAYLVHRLPLQHLLPGPVPQDPRTPAPAHELVAIPAGCARLGRSRAQHPHDGWDNEYDAHDVEVPAFHIERHAVTNADWLEFVDAGGYEDPELWHDADWAWRQRAGIDRPAGWSGDRRALQLRTMFGTVPLPMAWPVYVSHAEASAFARFRGLRLPSEAEWHRAALGTAAGTQREYPWGDAAPRPGHHGNFGFASWDPVAVDAHPHGQSAFGVHGLCGNGWQWTSTVFAPFAGFEPLPFYRGYSADFFDGRHFVMKGGSAVTATRFLRRSFRNWFQPHYQHVFAGFRCARDA